MNFNTYESRAISDVFVTIRSEEARAAIATVHTLAALRLRPLRTGYGVVSPPHEAFVIAVCDQIVARGFALHGFDIAFERRLKPRTQGSPSA